mgnify:CR=1 FL=1
MAVFRLRYVQTVMKNGRPHYYFRRPGYPRCSLPGYAGSAEFMQAYAQAMAGKSIEIGAFGTISGSMKALAIAWRASSQFKGLRTESRKTYIRLMDGFLAAHGDKLVKNAQPKHILAILEGMSDTPAQANALRNVLRQMFQFAFNHGWRSDNPARDVQKLRYKKKPFPTWTEEDIAAFEAHWSLDTRARLALALLLYTGQRRSDVIRMGSQHVSDGGIDVIQVKTGTPLHIPMHPELKEVLESHPADTEAFLMTQQGKPFASGNAFYNWFKECAVKAGIQSRLGPHGLRKAAARRLAEAGCTTHQIAAITGHKSLAEIERYTKEVSQKRVAAEAILKLGRPGRS